jgi:hypothetical protein
VDHGAIAAAGPRRTAENTRLYGPAHVTRLNFIRRVHFATHETVKHSVKAYVRGDVHTSSADGYFSIFKRGMRGVYEKHLHRYLAEYDFRYNHRTALGFNDGERAALAVRLGAHNPPRQEAAVTSPPPHDDQPPQRAALVANGVPERTANNAAGSGRGPWRLARSRALSLGLSNAHFRSLGLPSLFRAC